MRRRTRPGCGSSSWCRGWSCSWSWTRLAGKQPIASVHHYLSPIAAFLSSASDVGSNTNRSLRTYGSERYQGFAEVVLRYLCRRGIWPYDVGRVAVEGSDTSHERVSGVKSTQRERIEFQVFRVVVRIIAVC